MTEPSPSQRSELLLREVASELDRASRHALVAAEHIAERNAPRMAAHIWAAQGHLVAVRDLLDQAARLHAGMATLDGDGE